MNNVKRIGCLLMAIISSGCSAMKETPEVLTHDNLNSTLWVQTAAEYRANSIQTFRAAELQLDTAIAKGDWRAMLEQKRKAAELPPAIVLDVDETVLDNSPFQAMMIEKNVTFASSGDAWDEWVGLAQAKAIPGVVELINAAIDRGIAVVYLTNRECKMRPGNTDPCPQIADTIKNLLDVGIKSVDENLMLLKSGQSDWVSEKLSRRLFLVDKYRVIMLFGDDLGDFLPNVKSDISPEQRAKLVDKYRDRWGTHWFALANPTYGSWMRVLPGSKPDNLTSY